MQTEEAPGAATAAASRVRVQGPFLGLGFSDTTTGASIIFEVYYATIQVKSGVVRKSITSQFPKQ